MVRVRAIFLKWTTECLLEQANNLGVLSSCFYRNLHLSNTSIKPVVHLCKYVALA
jgi:hypothetical protein